MPITTTSDIEDRLGRPLTSSEAARVDGLIAETAALIDSYTRGGINPNQPPPPVRIVASRIAARALTNGAPPDGATSIEMTALAFGQTRSYPSAVLAGGIWLNRHDRTVLRGYRNHHATNMPTAL